MKPSFINSTRKRVVKVGNTAKSISTVVFCFDSSADSPLLPCPLFRLVTSTVSHTDEVFEPAFAKTSRANMTALANTARETLPSIPDRVTAGIYGGMAMPTQVVPDAHAKTIPLPEQPALGKSIVQPRPNTPHWSPAVQSTLDQPPAAFPRRLILGGLCFVSLAMAWACIGQVEEIGHAKGQLIPKGEVFKVHPTTMGRIAVLTVDEGQPVEAGQIIAELETTFEANEIERLEEALTADQIQLSQHETLLERVELEGRTNAEIAAANIRAHEAAIAQAEAHTEASHQLLTQLQHDVAASEIRVERIKPSVEQGGISQEYFFSAEQTLRDRQQNLTQQQGEIERSITEITQLHAELDQKQAEADRVQHEIQQQAQRLEVEITELKADITEKERLLARAEAELAQRFLYAPVDGTISSVSVNNVGEVVQPGQTIAEIAPEGAPLVLSAFLPDKEAGFIEAGMPVQVKFDAYPFQDYGIILGQVTSVAPDAIVDEKLGTVYRLEVTLERNHVENEGKVISFKAGQTADADIVIRKRRVIDILLDPIRKLKVSGIDL